MSCVCVYVIVCVRGDREREKVFGWRASKPYLRLQEILQLLALFTRDLGDHVVHDFLLQLLQFLRGQGIEGCILALGLGLGSVKGRGGSRR
jgi:hypothetical protein